jgi:hypothetical protein
MQQADNVSEDDLYLLHEIMIRCENAATDADSTEQIPGQQSIEEYMTPEETESEEKQNE